MGCSLSRDHLLCIAGAGAVHVARRLDCESRAGILLASHAGSRQCPCAKRAPPPVRKYSLARRPDVSLLTEPSNVVAYGRRYFALPKLRKQCHPERSEGPFATPRSKVPRCARDDTGSL